MGFWNWLRIVGKMREKRQEFTIYKGGTMVETKEKYGLGRFINGICLNPLEFVLGDDDKVMEFNDVEEVKRFAKEHGATEDDFEDACLHVVRFKDDGEYEIL